MHVGCLGMLGDMLCQLAMVKPTCAYHVYQFPMDIAYCQYDVIAIIQLSLSRLSCFLTSCLQLISTAHIGEFSNYAPLLMVWAGRRESTTVFHSFEATGYFVRCKERLCHRTNVRLV